MKQFELEQELITSVKDLTKWNKIPHIIEKADEECIYLSDEAINYKGLNGITPAGVLVWLNENKILRYLVDNYDNVEFNTEDSDRQTNALFLALKNDNTGLAQFLLTKGFNINQKLSKKHYDGNTIFLQLCDPKPYMSLTEETLIYILENMKPDLSITNKKNQTAYDVLISKCPSHCRKNITPILKKAVEDYQLVIKEKKSLEKTLLKKASQGIKIKM
jgi:hypothetical protein